MAWIIFCYSPSTSVAPANPHPNPEGVRRGQRLEMDAQGWRNGQREEMDTWGLLGRPPGMLGLGKTYSFLKGSRSKTFSIL